MPPSWCWFFKTFLAFRLLFASNKENVKATWLGLWLLEAEYLAGFEYRISHNWLTLYTAASASVYMWHECDKCFHLWKIGAASAKNGKMLWADTDPNDTIRKAVDNVKIKLKCYYQGGKKSIYDSKPVNLPFASDANVHSKVRSLWCQQMFCPIIGRHYFFASLLDTNLVHSAV